MTTLPCRRVARAETSGWPRTPFCRMTSSAISPLLSTAILVFSGYAAYSHILLLACLLVTAGAVLAASDLLLRRGSA